MDWFSWLSKTGLDPSLVDEYGQTFSQNELEQEDIPYFNHEFLQSMGISIAKHRLEILKIAKKDKGGRHPISRLFVAIKRTKRCLAKYFQTLVHRKDSALVVVSRRSSYSSRWKSAMLKRNTKLNMSKQGRLLITNDGFSTSPIVHDIGEDEKVDEKVEGVEDECYWSSDVEEIRWDTMFQNLKPT